MCALTILTGLRWADYTQNAAQRVGRQLAAKLDMLCAMVIPPVFVAIIVIEFYKLEIPVTAFVGESLAGTKEHRTYLEMVDQRGLIPGSTPETCNGFYHNKAYDPILQAGTSSSETPCDQLMADANDTNWTFVIITTVVCAVLFLTLVIFFRYILVFLQDTWNVFVQQVLPYLIPACLNP